MVENLTEYIVEFNIMASDVDFKGFLKPNILLDYLQNTAWAHYNEVEKQKGKILSDNLIWVISKIKLQLQKIPVWQDKIYVKTWATKINRFFAYRNFEIKDDKGENLAISTFSWLVVDKEKKKPIRPEIFANKFPIKDASNFFDLNEKINFKNHNKVFLKKINVNYSDMDINNHTNNTKYLQWVIDCFELNLLKEYTIKAIEMNFLAESFYGDELLIFKQEIDEKTKREQETHGIHSLYTH